MTGGDDAYAPLFPPARRRQRERDVAFYTDMASKARDDTDRRLWVQLAGELQDYLDADAAGGGDELFPRPNAPFGPDPPPRVPP